MKIRRGSYYFSGVWTPTSGDAIINLGDNAGVNKFYVKDSDGATVASIDSNGTSTIVLDDIVEGDIQLTGGGVIRADANANQLYLATGGEVIVGGGALKNSVADFEVQGSYGIATFTRSDVSNAGGVLSGYKDRAGAVVVTGDDLFEVHARGFDGSDYANTSASIKFSVTGTVAGNRVPGQIEFLTAVDAAPATLGTSAIIHNDAMLDLYGGTITILAGAENGAKTRNNSTNKQMRFAVPHFDQATPEEPMAVIYAQTATSANQLNLGGGNNAMNAATLVRIYAADDNNTLTGTEVARFEGGASKALMLGLGNSALEDWTHSYTAFHVGGNGSIAGETTGGAGKTVQLSNNAFYSYNGGSSRWEYMDTTFASNYYQAGGSHIFRVAVSGTAYDPITWTTALTINNDASSLFGGDVTIVDVGGAQSTLSLGDGGSAQYYGRVDFHGNSIYNGATLGYMPFYNKRSGSDVISASVEVAHDGAGNDDASRIMFSTFGTSLVEALRLDQSQRAIFGGDVHLYQAVNDGNPVLNIGSSSTERLGITASYQAGTQTLESIDYKTYTASSSGDYGEQRWFVDETMITKINDGGFQVVAGTLGIGVAPNVNRALYVSGAVTATGSYWGLSLDKTITAANGASAFGVGISPNFVTDAAGTHTNIIGAYITAPTVTNSGSSITNLASLYVAGAPSFAGTVTNGPYSIFVDAGDVRFDGAIIGGSTLAFDGTLVQGAPVTETLDGSGRMDYVHSNIIVAANTGSADDLEIITTAPDGALLIIRPDTGDTITVVNTGNFKLDGGADFVMSSVNDRMYLQGDGTNWIEISRSGNS